MDKTSVRKKEGGGHKGTEPLVPLSLITNL